MVLVNKMLVYFSIFPAFLCFLSLFSRNSRPPSDYLKRSRTCSGYNSNILEWGLPFTSLLNSNIIFMSFFVLFILRWMANTIFICFFPISLVFLVWYKILFIIVLFVWVRAAFPRYRRSINDLNVDVFLPLS